MNWLGFTWNLEQGVIEVPENKMENIQRKISLILNGEFITARSLASILGKLISLIPALDNICQLMMRNTCTAVCESNTWDLLFFISPSVRSELEFWLKNCKSLPKRLVCPIQNQNT